MKVLVVAAHPDDEVLGVGGTVAAHADRGDDVVLAVMCEGVSVRYEPGRHAEVQEQTRRSASLVGASGIEFCCLPDQRLDTLPLSEVAACVEQLVHSHRPEVVYTHFGGDVNRDHRVLTEATLVATRPYSAPFVRDVLLFETPSSTEWGTPHLLPSFQPSLYVDISATLDRKVDAFLCYSAEVRPFPHPRSADALVARARYWGSLVNVAAAEPFAAVRMVR